MAEVLLNKLTVEVGASLSLGGLSAGVNEQDRIVWGEGLLIFVR